MLFIGVSAALNIHERLVSLLHLTRTSATCHVQKQTPAATRASQRLREAQAEMLSCLVEMLAGSKVDGPPG